MKILIVDREDIPAQMMTKRLEPVGHEITHEPDKNNMADCVQDARYDVIIMDPSPVKDPRSLVLNIRSTVGPYPYVILMSENEVDQIEAIKGGCNDVITKPVDLDALDEKMINAESLLNLTKRIGNTDEDFPSAGGIIAKSAFNQLFLSAIERADRYGERSYLLFIAVSNYKEIVAMDGQSAADDVAAQLSQLLVKLRRQSDIIGQTGKNEFTLLLQHAADENEPMEAAARFAEALGKADDVASSGTTAVEMAVKLVDLPVGRQMVEHTIAGKGQEAKSA